MIFFSGVAGLVYQVLWMRQLGLLFGNTAHAAAATLAVFFAGLAAGSWFWGKRVSIKSNTLQIYAFLEAGICISALLYFGIIYLFHMIYPFFFQLLGAGVMLFLIKCLLAVVLVFPPAFFMGGTIPVIGQYLIKKQESFGTTSAMIYAINTLGAALGAFVAVFVLVPHLGFNLTCVTAIGISFVIALLALLLSRYKETEPIPVAVEEAAASLATPEPQKSEKKKNVKKGKGKKKRKKKKVTEESVEKEVENRELKRPAIIILAFFSGFYVLALEVLWTRMLAQIHENSVYSFAMVLVIVLLCLSMGALLAAFIANIKVISPRISMALLLFASGVVLAFSPSLFIKLTGNLSLLPTNYTFIEYFIKLFTLSFSSIAPPCLLLGTVFPFLMKSEEAFATHPGRSIGYLSAFNTVGSILGSLFCGFVLLRFLGMWWTVQIIAASYIVLAIIIPARFNIIMVIFRLAGVAFLILIFTWLNPSGLNVIGIDTARGTKKIIKTWETSDCTVAVIETSQGNKRIIINSNYILGSSGALEEQEFQSRVPLLLFPQTESIFFLGMGTGISTGAALDKKIGPAVKRVVSCELVPEVVTASKLYMAGGTGDKDYTNGLFKDDRVEIVVDDGRHYLMATKEKFDMINADLFLPYRSGAGSLYSRENFVNAKKRLTKDGVFVQWLPLFQMTDYEFGVITRTMLSVFDQVTMWQIKFIAGNEIVAMIGHNSKKPIHSANIDISEYKSMVIAGKNWQDAGQLPIYITKGTVPLLYCGNVTASEKLFEKYPINTDNRPLIEYESPYSLRKKSRDNMPINFVGPRFADLVDKLFKKCPPESDPILSGFSPASRRLPLAGAALHRIWIGYALQDEKMCIKAWNDFVREWTDQ